MVPQTLIITSDSKTLEVVSQILTEFSVPFEHSQELAVAIKRVLTESFQAVIVDCDDVQNASLVLSSVRGSNLNHRAMTVAIADGKAGVPTAFRLGARMVLSKPLSLDQARGTLRTAMAIQRRDSRETDSGVPGAAILPGAAIVPGSAVAPVENVTANRPHAETLGKVSAPPLSSVVASSIPVNKAPSLSSIAHSSGAASAPARDTEAASGKISAFSNPGTPQTAPPAAASGQRSTSSSLHLGRSPQILQKTAAKNSNSGDSDDAAEQSVPSFGMLDGAQSRRNPALLAVSAVAVIAIATAAAWYTQPALRKMALGKYGELVHRKEPVSAVPAPSTAPFQSQAPASAASTAADGTSTSVAAASSDSSTAKEGQSSATIQGFQDGVAASAEAAPAAPAIATDAPGSTGASQVVIVPQEVADAHVPHRVNAWYPTRARRAHISGAVIVIAQVAADGSVTSTDIASGDPQLALAAQEAVKQWKYQSYYQNGRPIAFQTQATVNFPPHPTKIQKP